MLTIVKTRIIINYLKMFVFKAHVKEEGQVRAQLLLQIKNLRSQVGLYPTVVLQVGLYLTVVLQVGVYPTVILQPAGRVVSHTFIPVRVVSHGCTAGRVVSLI